MYLFEFFLLFLVTVAPVLLAIAFFTLAERKIIAAIQRRKGPNVIFFWGILQPIADGLKAILKELVFPKRIDFFFFLLGPLLTFLLSLVG
jgi:NADH-quinone oxidoreductase subunit H